MNAQTNKHAHECIYSRNLYAALQADSRHALRYTYEIDVQTPIKLETDTSRLHG